MDPIDKIDVSMSYTYGDDDAESPRSITVTMYCAGVPDAPEPPTVVLGNRNIISVAWAKQQNDGGSSVTGFKLFMKEPADTEYTLISTLDEEDPTLLHYTTTTAMSGAPPKYLK